MKPFAIVIPWYGAALKGGAEQQAFQIATRLAARGRRVEVLTTCCRSFQDDWTANHLPPGTTEEHGVIIRRFLTEARDREAFDRVNAKLLALTPLDLRPGVCPVSAADAEIFVTQNINSPALLEHLRAQRDHYQAFLFIPYMFAPATQGVPLVAPRAFLQPCLHDEPAAYLPAVEDMFRRARFILFNSDGERELAARLYGAPVFAHRSLVTGEGIERELAAATSTTATVQQQLAAAAALPAELCGGAPFVLYLGRRDEAKNINLLIRAYHNFRRRAPQSKLKLVLAGAGAQSYDERERGIFDLGVVSEDSKAALLSRCRALFQPSRNESFSRVLMEAWSNSRPVAAHRECLATAIAVERSAGGGWLAASEDEWSQTFSNVASAAVAELDQMGARGRLYADEHADWDKVISRYEALLDSTVELSNAATTTSTGARGAAIHQLLPDITYGDAISNQAIAIRDYLRSRGHASEIFVKRCEERMKDEAQLFDPARVRAKDALLYHHSIGSELTAFAVAHAGAKCLIYHNITPARYFAPYRPGFAWMLETGRAHLPRLAPHFPCSVGDSAYNAAELAANNFSQPGVLPIICDPTKWTRERADPALMERLQDGRTNLLFVGRIAPNKKQDELVEAFAHYHASDANSRLVIAGEGRASDPYHAHLLRTITARGLDEHVNITGQITNAELLAYYRTAHLYWSLSEHEGFGVPLVEAMWFDVPVLAYRSTATPETLGEAGMTFESKEDLRGVALLAKLLTPGGDKSLRRRVIAAGRVRREAFTPASVHSILDELIARMEQLNLSQRAEEEVA